MLYDASKVSTPRACRNSDRNANDPGQGGAATGTGARIPDSSSGSNRRLLAPRGPCAWQFERRDYLPAPSHDSSPGTVML